MDPQDPTDDAAVPADDAPGETAAPEPMPDAGSGEPTPGLRPSWEPL